MKLGKIFSALSFTCAVLFMASHANAGQLSSNVECQKIRAANPDLVGKNLVNAINPHTPGYEALDPNDPSKYVGFDIDLGENIADCLGAKISYKSVAFANLLPTLQSGQADIVISDIYATSDRAKAADFITYSKVFDGVLVKKGNPKKITGINESLCGTSAAENTGFVEVPLIEDQSNKCVASGKPKAEVQLYDNNANCIQAILSGRADVYINDVNTVDQAVKAYPDKLEKATAVTLPYSIGIAVPKNKVAFRTAVMDALKVVQSTGIQKTLSVKWGLGENSLETPRLILD